MRQAAVSLMLSTYLKPSAGVQRRREGQERGATEGGNDRREGAMEEGRMGVIKNSGMHLNC